MGGEKLPENEDNVKVVNIHYTQRVEGIGAVYSLEALADSTAQFHQALVRRGMTESVATVITAVMLKPARESTESSNS